MRASSAVGGFLVIAGVMTLILKPVYNAGSRPQAGIEAVGPVQDIRPVPAGAAPLSVGAGFLCLTFAWRTRHR
jgi:hypothetical protein